MNNSLKINKLIIFNKKIIIFNKNQILEIFKLLKFFLNI